MKRGDGGRRGGETGWEWMDRGHETEWRRGRKGRKGGGVRNRRDKDKGNKEDIKKR